MAHDSNRTCSGSIAPARQNTPAAPAIFFASPPAENMLRGGQARRPLSLGLHHLGIQERVLQRLVIRGADGYVEYPPSMRSELETSPTSKHAREYFAFPSPRQHLFFRFLFVANLPPRRPSLPTL